MLNENMPTLQLISPQVLALDADFSPLSMSLYKILQRRCSSREFGAADLSLYRLSRLLWAAFGINRPEQGLRTAPSAANKQEIDIYVALRTGLYRFDAKQLALHPVCAVDLRAATGGQDYVAEAPLDLIYVATFDNDGISACPEQRFYGNRGQS